MLTVDDFAPIRQARRDGLTIRQIAEQFGHSTKTILKALAESEPQPYTLAQPRTAPIFGPFRTVVDHILEADQTAPPKQRHTAAQLYRRLCREYGYSGGYDQVRRYLHDRRRQQRATFIPLEHPPGHRAEADFGHIHVDFPEGRRQIPVLLVTWSYSNCPFAIAVPTERTEALLHGLVEAFAFFGCVPRELWWDNPTTVASHVGRGRQRTLHPRYLALTSHYNFSPKFCLPATPTEKPRVEHRVYDLQRRWATPVPQVADRDALNAHLVGCCLGERALVSGAATESVGVRFQRERAAALPVPAVPFDACVLQTAQVDKYQTVRFDGNAYSVPRRWAFQTVTVKGYSDRIAVVAAGQVVAEHPRSYGRGARQLDPLHYLVTLGRKPAALDHAPVYRDWQLPPVVAARIRAAGFPVLKDFDTYDFSALPSLPKQKVLELARGEWLEQRDNCCLIGSVGTGKTHLATARGLAACRQGQRVRFFTAAELVLQLEEAQQQHRLDRLLGQLDRTDLLICDELGYVSFSRMGAELLFQVFAERYERRSLLLTSNLAFSEWGQVFQGERMTAALLDRLTHRCHIFEMNGESDRFREPMKAKKDKEPKKGK